MRTVVMVCMACCAAVVFRCSHDGDFSRNNPYDARGDNFQYNQPPESLYVASGRWVMFNSASQHGNLAVYFKASDPNGPYDTLTYQLYLKDSTGNFSLLYTGTDTTALVPHIKTGDTISYRILVVDIDSNVIDSSGFITASTKAPPQPPSSFYVSNYSTYTELRWHGSIDNRGGYRLYRSNSLTGPYRLLVDTAWFSSSAVRYYDEPQQYGPHYYLLASYDTNGENLYGDTLMGWRYYASLSSPSISVKNFPAAVQIRMNASYSSAEKYYLLRGAGSADYRLIATVAETSFSYSGSYTYYYDFDVDSANSYSYRAAAGDGLGRVSNLCPNEFITYTGIASLSFSVSSGSYKNYIRISWDALNESAGYFVYRGSSKNGPYVKIDSTNSTVYHDSVPTTDTYFYKVTFNSAYGKESSLPSTARSGYRKRLSAPYSFSAANGTYIDFIYLDWNSVSDASGYYVYRAMPSTGEYVKIDSTAATFYRDSVPDTDTYYYKAAAYSSTRLPGSLSSSDAGYLKRLSSPSGVSASTGIYPDYIRVAWRALSGAMGYYIYRSTDRYQSDYALIDSTSDTVFQDAFAEKDTVYYYRIAGKSTKGPGTPSNYAFGYRMKKLPRPSAVTYDNFLRINIDCQSWAEGYLLYRAQLPDGHFTLLDSLPASHCYYRDTVRDTGLYAYKISAYNAYGVSDPSDSATGSLNLATPYGLKASDKIKSLYLSWNKSAGAQSYIVSRRFSSAYAWSAIDTVNDTFYVDTPLTAGLRYHYAVRAYNRVKISPYSTYLEGGALSNPAIPASFSVTNGASSVYLSWSRNYSGSQPDGYYIYRSASAYVSKLYDSTTQTSYHDSLDNDSLHYYKVEAYNAIGKSGYSNTRSGKLSAPLAPAVSICSYCYGDHIHFWWQRIEGAQYYYIYRSSASSNYSLIDSTTDTVYHDWVASLDTPYYYRIATGGIAGLGSKSPPQSAQLLAYPSSIQTTSDYGHILVSWSLVDGAAGYVIYRATDSAGVFTLLDSTSSTEYTDSVSTALPYFYRISAYNRGESRYSPVYGPGKLVLPEVPTGVRASGGLFTDTILVSWSAASGAASYQLFKGTDESGRNITLVSTLSDTFHFDTVASDSLYYYRVKSANPAGQSVLSSPAESGFRKPVQAPAAPTSLSDSSAGGFIRVTWAPAASGHAANGFKVYRADTRTGNYSLVGTTLITRYDDYAPLSFPSTYWYKVKAYNSVGDSPFSSEIEGFRN
ncbi:MAG: hypothetical protein GF398_01355 [Chitinivibrionales bacterium]|nr:hypothetical protein [Chitinivibrionales bacterium]